VQEFGNWILTNANAISGYLILIIAVVAFIWAVNTNRIYMGENVDRLIAHKNAEIARCEEELQRYQFPKGGSP